MTLPVFKILRKPEIGAYWLGLQQAEVCRPEATRRPARRLASAAATTATTPTSTPSDRPSPYGAAP